MTTVKKPAIRSAWRAQFERTYEEGRFKAAAEVFDSHAGNSERPEVILQAARAHMNADPASALRLLLKLRLPRSGERDKVERDALLIEAFSRTRDFESADERLKAALKSARKLGDGDLLTTVGYRGVRRYLLAQDPARARTYLDYARTGRSSRSRIYAAYAETIILSYEERVLEQAERLTELLRSLDPNKTDFVSIRAWSTHTLAVLARDLHIPAAIPGNWSSTWGDPVARRLCRKPIPSA